MTDNAKSIEFKHEPSGTVFEATLESDAAPKPSYFQWVHGLPEALRKPGVAFHTTKGPGMMTLTVGCSTTTGGIVERPNDGVLCQITAIVSQSVLDDFASETDRQTKANMKAALEGVGAGAPDLGKSAQARGVAETTFRSETPLADRKKP